jgi:hypothetical protein
MDEPLVGLSRGDDRTVPSQAQAQAQGSLLERIRATQENSNVVPNYTPVGNDAFAGGGDGASSSFGFSSLSLSFGGGEGRPAPEPSQGLLSEHNNVNYPSPGGEYSMQQYFVTFVMDVYNAFRSLPIPAQAASVVGLLWIAWKLF